MDNKKHVYTVLILDEFDQNNVHAQYSTLYRVAQK